jgi:hypothetical protein
MQVDFILVVLLKSATTISLRIRLKIDRYKTNLTAAIMQQLRS